MEIFSRLVREAHRRSLWQVLSIYLMGSWVVLQVVESLTESAGLPDWVPPLALVLLLIGLPVVVATAFVQEGMGGKGQAPPVPAMPDGERPVTSPGPQPGVEARLHRRVLTWRNAILAGGAAFVVLGLAVALYLGMWKAGIGPVGSLVAQGILDERAAVVLAEFQNATDEEALGQMVAEALRVDLLQSPVLTVVEPAFVGQVLRRMQRDPASPLTAELAREVAEREGLKAVIEGEVGRVGSGYLLSARIVAAADRSVLAAFRETAPNADALLGSIDKLSQNIREKAGESLRSVRRGEPLGTVTTSSLEALRKYTQAEALTEQGQTERALDLFEEAVTLDPDFAMAWRKLAVLLNNLGRDRERAKAAATRAYELRDRLTDRERYLAVAYYHYVVTLDFDQASRAYRSVLDAHPDDRVALNNLAIILRRRNDIEGALTLLERAVSGPGETVTAHTNLVDVLMALARVEDARTALARFDERNPGQWRTREMRSHVEFAAGDLEAAEAAAREGLGMVESTLLRNGFLHDLATVEVARGKLASAEDHFRLMAENDSTAVEHAMEDLTRVDALARHDPAAALRRIERARQERPFDRHAPAVWPAMLEAGLNARAGRVAAVEVLLPRLREEGASLGSRALDGNIAGIRGLAALGAGDFERAVALFEDARRLADCGNCYLPEMGIAHQEAGRGEAALPLFRRYLVSGEFGLFNALFDPELLERSARIHEEAGDTTAALEAWRSFAERWKEADPELQPRVAHARARIAALGG